MFFFMYMYIRAVTCMFARARDSALSTPAADWTKWCTHPKTAHPMGQVTIVSIDLHWIKGKLGRQ